MFPRRKCHEHNKHCARIVENIRKQMRTRKNVRVLTQIMSMCCGMPDTAYSYSAALKRSLNCSTLTSFSSTVTASLTAAHIMDSAT